LYKALNDEQLLDRILSEYHEYSSQQTSCTLRSGHERGANDIWSISTGFAYQGGDRWTIGVILNHKPDSNDIDSYCETLLIMVDWMRDPHAREPTFPGTEKPLIWKYPNGH